jgi:hypothetical protein
MSFFDKLRSSRISMTKPLIIEKSYNRRNISEHKNSHDNQIPNPLTIGGKTIDVWEME